MNTDLISRICGQPGDGSRRNVAIAIAVVVVCQIAILLGMLVKASWPLYVGEEIQVETIPVDPRSLFRGNYARLNYDFSRLSAEQLKLAPERAKQLRKGEVVYLSLVKNSEGNWQGASAALTQPEEGVFLRGRIQNARPPYRVLYGIEAWFAPKKDALALETELRNGGIAVLMVSSSGRAALKAVKGDS